jgi:hypothetical protein
MRESVEVDLRKTRTKRDDHEATIAGAVDSLFFVCEIC